MEWVCVYLTLVKNLPVLGVGEEGLQNGRGVHKRECGYERHILVRHA